MEWCRLPDGRRAQLWTGGAPSGPTVLVCPGTPDTRWVARTGAAAAEAAGVRLASVNRPGYGGSDPAAASGSALAAAADDAVAVLDALDVERCAVLGMSVGGLYAAALAGRHPDRVTALGVVAAPREEPVEVSRAEFEAWVTDVDPTDPDDDALAARWLATLPAEDAALLRDLGPGWVAASAREALASPEGYLRDAAVLGTAWAAELEAVRAPAHLWFGERDDRNPPATGRWWAERLPRAELTTTPTTHLATLLTGWPAVLATLTRE